VKLATCTGEGGTLADDADACLECKLWGNIPPTPEEGDPPANGIAPCPETPCRIDEEGEEPEPLEIVLDLNGWTGLRCGLLIGSAPGMGEDESDDVPPTLAPAGAVVVPVAPAENRLGFDGFAGLAGYGYGFGLSRSLVEIDEEDDEFKLSLRRRCTANPDAGIGWAAAAATDVVDGFAEGKAKEGRGGGMSAVVPVVGAPILGTLVGRMNRSATIGSPPADVVLLIPTALGGERDSIERIPLLFGRDEDPESESRCLFLSSVGTNPSRLSEMKRDERRDSSSSSWKCGVDRYVVCSVNEPRRCGTGGKVWVLVGNGERWVGESRSSENRI
jgi:hypothetical protein